MTLEPHLTARFPSLTQLDVPTDESLRWGSLQLDASGLLRFTHRLSDQVGQLALPRPQRSWPVDYFALSLELLAVGHGSFSISFGDVGDDAPLIGVGANGAGAGLRLVFGTSAPRTLGVFYDGVQLRSLPLPSTALGAAVNDHVVAPTFEAVQASYRDDGLHVSLGSTVLVRSLPIYGWAPATSWRIVLAASSGSRIGTHHVRSLSTRTGAAVHRAPVPLELSLNGQQFSSGAFPFIYHAAPRPLTVLPPTGPTRGDTLVRVYGASLADGASFHRCLFGSVSVNGTLDLPSKGVLCRSPLAPAGAGYVNISIELTRDTQVWQQRSCERERTLLPWTARRDACWFAWVGCRERSAHGKGEAPIRRRRMLE